MKVLFVFKVFVFLSTSALATVCEDRFISAEFVVNNVSFTTNQWMAHARISLAVSRDGVSRP